MKTRYSSAFDSSAASQLQVVSALLERGLFNEFRSRPFNNIPSPEEKPSSIIVQLSNQNVMHDYRPLLMMWKRI